MANIDIKMEDEAYKILSVAKELNKIKSQGCIELFREKGNIYGLKDEEISIFIKKLLGVGYLRRIMESNEEYLTITEKGRLEYLTQSTIRRDIKREKKVYQISIWASILMALFSIIISLLAYISEQTHKADTPTKAYLENRLELNKHEILHVLDSLCKTKHYIDDSKKKYNF